MRFSLLQLLAKGIVLPHGEEHVSNVHVWRDRREDLAAHDDDFKFEDSRTKAFRNLIKNKTTSIRTKKEFEEAEAAFLKQEFSMISKSDTDVGLDNLHKV
jgi:hypothetical protein